MAPIAAVPGPPLAAPGRPNRTDGVFRERSGQVACFPKRSPIGRCDGASRLTNGGLRYCFRAVAALPGPGAPGAARRVAVGAVAACARGLC